MKRQTAHLPRGYYSYFELVNRLSRMVVKGQLSPEEGQSLFDVAPELYREFCRMEDGSGARVVFAGLESAVVEMMKRLEEAHPKLAAQVAYLRNEKSLGRGQP